jgi:superfamily I DNA and RNA helicase
VEETKNVNTRLSIVQGTNSKPASSRALVACFAQYPTANGELFIGYPIIGTPEGRHPIDALWISPEKGVVVFDIVEGSDPGDYTERQDDAANKLEARLKAHKELMRRRDLLVQIHTLSFAPGIADTSKYQQQNYMLANAATLSDSLSQILWKDADTSIFESTLSALQNISTIRKGRTKRILTKEDSRGAKLKHLEDSIATLDNLQSKAVIETVDGVQRIRGLAGSGKTIVLALKAAYLHAQHPDWRIAVTFNTRSLKGQFRRLINTFTIEQTSQEPDWENVCILNAWGAPGGVEREGIYHEFCRAQDIQYFDFRSAKSTFRRGQEFAGACDHALKNMRSQLQCYDAILVDEAQDFPPAFLRLCYEILKERKRLVYAYDELQNLSGVSLPSPEEIFGKHPDGTPRVTFDDLSQGGPQRDVILEKCYRNSRPVLVTAHALGFGIYRRSPKNRDTGLVQMFGNAGLWEEIGYEVRAGVLQDGHDVVLQRPPESSPRFLEDHSPLADLIEFKAFKTEDEQAEWVSKEIARNITEEELRHDDIVVINPDPLTTRSQSGPIRHRLLKMGIPSHLAGVDTNPDVFFEADSPSVTFTGIYRAKGNEAGMVYVINAQDCQTATFNLANVRNRLFTAITRSKAWVRVIGVGPKMKELIEEYKKLEAANFELRFRYPTQEQREQLSIVHRDMTAAERKRLKTKEKDLADLVQDLEMGNVHPEDLDEELLRKLEMLLKKRRS